MSATTFSDGVTIVDATWLNKHFGPSGHVHDGVDADGSAPKVNLYTHTTLGTYAELLLFSDTNTNHHLEMRHTTLAGSKMTLGLPTVRLRGSLYFGPSTQADDAADGATSPQLSTVAVTGPTDPTDWVALRFGPSSKRTIEASGFTVRRQSPDGSESIPGSSDAGRASTLYESNLIKVRANPALRTAGTIDLPGASIQFNASAVTIDANGQCELTLEDALPWAANVTFDVASVSTNKTGDLYVYSAQRGATSTTTFQFYIYEHTISTGAIRLVTPASPPNIDVSIHIQAL